MTWVLAGERNSATPNCENKHQHHRSTTTQTAVKAKCIKLGIDVHANSYRVVRQFDHATPQPAQKFTSKDFLVWAKKQLALGEALWLPITPDPIFPHSR